METNRPMVSVYCMTYNHEKYIKDCLEGFLKQKTTFPFEVIVHDDASTDNTQMIIKEYEKKYPDIIKGVYQIENQHSKKIVPIVKKFIFPNVKGKYIAICEGDDYWTDEYKLQMQVELMENNKNCHFCTCGVEEVSLNKKSLGILHPAFEIKEQIISSDEFVNWASSYSFQTSSYLIRYEDWKEYLLFPPEFRKKCDIGDLPMLLYYGSMGEVAYVNKVMSCYRRGALDSYSAKKNNWTEEKRIEHFRRSMETWISFDEYSKQKFHAVCVNKVAHNLFGKLIIECNAGDFLKQNNREYYNALPIMKRIFVLVACLFPRFSKHFYYKGVMKREQKELSQWNDKINT